MSTDLEKFRDHCRAMAAGDQKLAASIDTQTDEDRDTAARLADDADLWTRLADEADAYLQTCRDNATDEHPTLWEHP